MADTAVIICNRRHADFLPHGNRADRNRRPVFHAAKHSAAFARQVHAGGLAKAERANVVVKFGGAQAQAHLNGADVAGICQDLRNGQIPVCLVVANAMPGDVDRAILAIDHFIRIRNALIDGRRQRHDLEDRPRLIQRARGAVHARLGIAILGGVRIERRPVRDGQQFA